MTVKDLKETLIGNELFEKIGFKMDDNGDYYVALNFGNIVVVQSDGTTTQYNDSDNINADYEREELLQDILDDDMDFEELEEKYGVTAYEYYSFGEWLTECSAADF